MKPETIKNYALSLPEAEMDFPFGNDVYVFKVKGKMFALLASKDGEMFLNLKLDPDEAASLRDIFTAIKPGYHMNKRHWISVYFNDEYDVPQGELERLIEASFDLVVSKLPKKQQTSILLKR